MVPIVACARKRADWLVVGGGGGGGGGAGGEGDGGVPALDEFAVSPPPHPASANATKGTNDTGGGARCCDKTTGSAYKSSRSVLSGKFLDTMQLPPANELRFCSICGAILGKPLWRSTRCRRQAFKFG